MHSGSIQKILYADYSTNHRRLFQCVDEREHFNNDLEKEQRPSHSHHTEHKMIQFDEFCADKILCLGVSYRFVVINAVL